MWTRAELKEQAKKAFNEQYWLCVGVLFVQSAIIAAVSAVTWGAASLFVIGPITVGMNYFYMSRFFGGNTTFDQVFSKGFVPYGRKLGGMLWMSLFTLLWSLLFWIPGIIKSFSYSMTPYILGDCPNVKAQDALKLSMRMMHGYKGELFVLYLSFIGWMILCSFTFGLLYILYVGPYMELTKAGFYGKVKTLALQNNVISTQELNPQGEY